MCLASLFQFPLFIIACVEELETTNKTSSNPQDMVNAGSKPLPSLLLLLSCLFLVLGVIALEASASPVDTAEPHHRHTRPWAAWHRTAHVCRDIIVPTATGAELSEISTSTNDYWVIDDHLTGVEANWKPNFTNEIGPFPRLPRDLLARTYECWRGGRLWSCVMRVLKTGEKADSSQ